MAAPKPTSTKSDRLEHQVAFKKSLIDRFECYHPKNRNVTKCMVLNHFFSTEDVIAAHLIGLTNLDSLLPLNLNRADVWSERNGVLVHREIEKKYESQEIVSF
jgi:hypothetical protein